MDHLSKTVNRTPFENHLNVKSMEQGESGD